MKAPIPAEVNITFCQKAEHHILVLNKILSLIRPNKQNCLLAKELMDKFGGLENIVSADYLTLRQIKGISNKVIEQLMLIGANHSKKLTFKSRQSINLSSYEYILGYYHYFIGYKKKKEIRVFYLDKDNNLLYEKIIKKGDCILTNLHIKEIIKVGLILCATSVMLGINNVSQEIKPSFSDIESIKRIQKCLHIIGIPLGDSIIINNYGDLFSFKKARIFL